MFNLEISQNIINRAFGFVDGIFADMQIVEVGVYVFSSASLQQTQTQHSTGLPWCITGGQNPFFSPKFTNFLAETHFL
jgi:hypothetical protein